MKAFNDVTITDKIYVAQENHWDFKEISIRSIDHKTIKCYDFEIERSDKTRSRENHSTQYRRADIIFSTKSEAIRYCKSFLMAKLQLAIETAKDAIEDIKKIRTDNFEKLNQDWLESTIQEMESELR